MPWKTAVKSILFGSSKQPEPVSWLWGFGVKPTYRDDFVEFLAQSRGIDPSEAQFLMSGAEGVFPGGWGGNEYRRFTELALETLRPFFDDRTDNDAIATYKQHQYIDFLRMISYSIPTGEDIAPIVSRLTGRANVEIVDYGCGLAHRTIAVSRALMEGNSTVKLYLVDISREPYLRFLDFLCKKYGIDYEFIEVTPNHLYPELPSHDYNDNVEVLEHVREPVRVIDNTDKALRPGGLFLAAVHDHIEEMMHISPNLGPVRERLASLGYKQIGSCYASPIFQKP